MIGPENLGVEDSIDLERARRESKARAAAFLAQVSTAVNERDDRIVAELANENSSLKSKLGKVYGMVAEATDGIQPFVACARGCSACCKMNVDISSLEAERLSAVSGSQMVQLAAPVRHSEDRFSGVPCPFLISDTCSVYEVRPYACRAHFSFDNSAHWCQPERAYVADMSLVNFGGAKEAYQTIATRTNLGGFADIRDFFPG